MTREPGHFPKHRIVVGCGLAVWLLFAASFFMPVTRGHSTIGWEAAWFYLSKLFDPMDVWQHVRSDPLEALGLTFNWTNITMLFAPLVLWCWPRWSGLLALLLTLGGAVPWTVFYDSMIEGALRIGFYCWASSILVMAGVAAGSWLGRPRKVCPLPRVDHSTFTRPVG